MQFRKTSKEKGYKGLIDETDFTGLCGNCHERLYKNDRYCRYCGTERGKGSFRPFRNEMYCVYGPQVKKKYRCTECGHIWITAVLGGDDSRFCPECGRQAVTTIEEKTGEFPMSGYFGMEEPFPPDDRPVLFTEKQTEKILSFREKEGAKSWRSMDDLLHVMREAGVDVPEEIDEITGKEYPKTEAEGEQLTLAERILKLEGSNIHGYKDHVCPYCKGNLIAGFKYRVPDVNKGQFMDRAMPADENDPLTYDARYTIQSSQEAEKNPAYLCLICGAEFGKYKMRPLIQ